MTGNSAKHKIITLNIVAIVKTFDLVLKAVDKERVFRNLE